MSKYVLKLLESYNERERKIAVLRYNLEHPTTVSRAEQIEAMNFRHDDSLGHSAGHISNKTLYIALNYEEQAERMNAGKNGMSDYTLVLTGTDGTNVVLTGTNPKRLVDRLRAKIAPADRRRTKGAGGIRRVPNGRVKAYRTVVDPNTGEEHRVSRTADTQAVAESRLREALSEFDRTHRVGYVRPPTVAEWMYHWLTDVCKPRLKPRTWGTYASVGANDIIPAIGKVRLDELKPAHFRRMERYITVEQGRSSGTAGSAWRTLHKALEDAVLEGVIERNPAVKGTAPRVALKERAALTPEQAADLIADETDDTWRLMWMLGLATACWTIL